MSLPVSVVVVVFVMFSMLWPGLAVPAGADPVTLVSKGVSGETIGGSPAAVSGDGRYVVFRSAAANVVAGQVDTNGTDDVFLFDRVADTMTLVSRSAAGSTTTGNGSSFPAAVSVDGRYVLFSSTASDLTATDTNGARDVFLFDRVAETVTLVSRSTVGPTTTGNGSSSGAP